MSSFLNIPFADRDDDQHGADLQRMLSDKPSLGFGPIQPFQECSFERAVSRDHPLHLSWINLACTSS